MRRYTLGFIVALVAMVTMLIGVSSALAADVFPNYSVTNATPGTTVTYDVNTVYPGSAGFITNITGCNQVGPTAMSYDVPSGAQPGDLHICTFFVNGAPPQGTFKITVGGTPPPVNQAPIAAFTANGGELSASFDASASSDPDSGDSIASYEWQFGDSTTGSGVTPTHSYATAGTYNVTLVVTDTHGATGTVSHSVTVTAPPPPVNNAPTAAFTATGGDLVANVDGSASSDPDSGDSIASYVWDFGDGTVIGAAATASHDYDYAGTYTVTLTVTDTRGASSSVSHTVKVTAPPLKVTVSDTTVVEPNTSATYAYLDVTLSRKSTKDVSIAYSTLWLPQIVGCLTGVTCAPPATPGVDYVSKTDILVIPAGQKTGQIKIKILPDLKKEKDESIIVVHLDFEGSNLIGGGDAVVTIDDND